MHRRLRERGHVREEGRQIDLLLIAAAERHAALLSNDRDDRLTVELRVVEPVQEMDRAGAGRGEADARLARELRVGARHEGRHLLVPHLDELEPLAGRSPEREDDAVDPVAGIPVDPLDTPLTESPEHEVADCLGHRQTGSRSTHEGNPTGCLRSVRHTAGVRGSSRSCGGVRHRNECVTHRG
jgi:hypothetical protein